VPRIGQAVPTDAETEPAQGEKYATPIFQKRYAPRAFGSSYSLRSVACLIEPAEGLRLLRLVCPPDPHPQQPAVIVATVEHQVGALRRFKLGIGTVIADQQIGSGVDL
jgi:hypothetical protein